MILDFKINNVCLFEGIYTIASAALQHTSGYPNHSVIIGAFAVIQHHHCQPCDDDADLICWSGFANS